ELRPMLAREVAHLIEVDEAVALAYAVRDAPPELARDADVPAVREMAAGREIEAHDRLAGLHEREVHGEVCGAPRVRLHVDVLGAEERLEAALREILDRVDVALALVVALVRVALGVLVGEDRARGLEHGARRVVLARDETESIGLVALFSVDEGGD